MPVLNWIGKDAVVRHDAEVPFRLLHDVPELACPTVRPERSGPQGREVEGQASTSPAPTGSTNSTNNLIVEGDNLLALKALLPHYGGQVKCIYIDPPYNTGNEGWVYNDAVNSPEMREWLGKVVGKEAEDLTRHDKWLCMMYPRLKLLKRFLREDGAIFISIDDVEVANLRLLMDEIYGVQNFVANFIWEKRKNRENRKVVSIRHDHIVCYVNNSLFLNRAIKPLPMDSEALSRYRNLDDDLRGPWKSDPATAQAGHGTQTQFYTLIAPNGKKHELPSGRCWVYTREVMDDKIKDRRIWFGVHGNNVPRIKTFLHEKERSLTPETILFAKDVATNEIAKNNLKTLFGGEVRFETPKSVELIEHLLRICMSEEDIILDSFAGSGTTAHAVLKLNSKDSGNRRFILVEMDGKIAREVTTERVKRVMQGYTNAKGEAATGLGGGFRYATLGKPLFAASGHINSEVQFAELARFVWFMETGVPWGNEPPSPQPSPASGRGDKSANGGREKQLSPLLGVHDDRAVYLLYNGILKDKSAGGGNVLTSGLLAELLLHDGPKTIYGARCLIKPERLRNLKITFKQLPYELKVAR